MLQVPGTFGEYTLKRVLGKGGMAEVYLAQSYGVGGFHRDIAIKIIHPHLSNDQEFVQMLIDEANLSAQLNHTNIVHIHHLGNQEGLYYIAMEFIDGCDVYQALVSHEKQDKRFPNEVAAWIAHEACAGLYYAHTKSDQTGQPLNIIHRDISPQNIQLSKEGDVKIVDFGIAKADQRQNHTQQGIIKGKYSYMSPEQAWGDQIDHRSDIFSLGICLYEMIAGEVLYDAEDGLGLLEQVRLAQIPSLRAIRADLPPELERIVYRALSPEPQDRYRDAEEMREALANYLYNARVSSGRQLIVTFMQGLNEESDRELPPSLDDQTQAVSVEAMRQLLPSVSTSIESFSDMDQTRAVSANIFSPAFDSASKSVAPNSSPKPNLLPSNSPPFEQEEKTRALATDQFSQLLPDSFEEEAKTRTVSAEVFSTLKLPALDHPKRRVNMDNDDKTKALNQSNFQGPFGSHLPPPPPPPPSLLAATSASFGIEFNGEEKTKAFNTNNFESLQPSHQSPAPAPMNQVISTPPPSPTPVPTPVPTPYVPSIATATLETEFPELDLNIPKTEPPNNSAQTNFPSPFRNQTSSEPDSETRIPLFPSEAEPVLNTRDSVQQDLETSSPNTKEKKRAAKKKKTLRTPRTRARKKSSSKIVMIVGLLIILSALIITVGPKLLRPPLPSQYSLSVSANAQGAKVYRDGQDTGQYTPALLQGLKPNVEYDIKVKAAGYEPIERTVSFNTQRITKQREQSLRLFMKRAKGTLRIKSMPNGASVYMNNEYLGKTPLFKRNMERAEGGVEIKFRREGCDLKVVILTWGDDLESLIEAPLRCR